MSSIVYLFGWCEKEVEKLTDRGCRQWALVRLLVRLASILGVLLFLAQGRVANAATFTVTNTTDSGADSLRQAILDANTAPGGPQGAACDIGAFEYQLSDTTPPTVTIVSVTPATLWPPNGKLVRVTVVVTITDAGSGVDPHTTAYTVEDEYSSVEPSGGPLTPGENNRYTATIALQASRRGNDADGRHYTITVSALDTEGNEGSADAIVTVPHDQGQSLAVQ